MTTPSEKMRASDAVWLQDTPENRMIINALVLTESMTTEAMRIIFREKVLEVEEGKRYARFRKRVVYRGATPYWEEVENFDLATHIVKSSKHFEDEKVFQAYLGEEAGKPLPENQPLWKLYCFENYQGGSAFFIRIHHCMADGIALIPILFSLIDDFLETQAEAGKNVSKPKFPLSKKLFFPFAMIGILVKKLFWKADESAMHGNVLSGTKKVAWTNTFNLIDVKAMRAKTQGTVNDVLMSCVSGAVKRYSESIGTVVPKKIRVSMPVNIRRAHEKIKMENKFAVALLELPVNVEPLSKQIQLVKAKLDALKKSAEPFALYVAVEIFIKLLPYSWSRGLINFFGQKCTCVTTNVPGPQAPIYMAGNRVKNMMFWVPQRANVGIGISILSLDGKVSMGVIADKNVMPSPALFCEKLEEQFEAMLKEFA